MFYSQYIPSLATRTKVCILPFNPFANIDFSFEQSCEKQKIFRFYITLFCIKNNNLDVICISLVAAGSNVAMLCIMLLILYYYNNIVTVSLYFHMIVLLSLLFWRFHFLVASIFVGKVAVTNCQIVCL